MVARSWISAGAAPGMLTITSSMGTTICGSSSRGVIRMAKAPASSAAAMNSGVSFEFMKVRATSPARRSCGFDSDMQHSACVFKGSGISRVARSGRAGLQARLHAVETGRAGLPVSVHGSKNESGLLPLPSDPVLKGHGFSRAGSSGRAGLQASVHEVEDVNGL